MPFYKLRDIETDIVWEQYMGINECDTFLDANQNIERLFNGCPMIVGGYGDRVKRDRGFTEVLQKVAEHHPTSELANTFGDKGSKATKIREAISKFQHKKI